MPDETFELGPVAALAADALGKPGERTFRIRARTVEQVATLWVEKEQLQALAIAIEQLLTQIAQAADTESPPPAETFLEPPSIEFKVGSLALGYIEESDLVALLVHSQEADPDGPATLVCLGGRGQFRALSRQIVEVCAAGRPRCPLCGDPIDAEGHHCVRMN